MPKTRGNVFLWHNTSNLDATQHWTLYIIKQRGISLAWKKVFVTISLCVYEYMRTAPSSTIVRGSALIRLSFLRIHVIDGEICMAK